jgi:glycosyltransferase involved in cell wall biosynthesis
MKASVIITTYQRSDFLIRAINSVLHQTCNDYEIIVVDDNGEGSEYQKSNDILLEKYIANNAARYVVSKENQGACKARNQGAFNACGEYLFFLDDDDEFLPEKLAYQVDFLEKNADYDAHLSAMTRINQNKKEIISIENIPRGNDFVSFAVNGNFFTPMMAIRKNVFLALNGFDDIFRFQDQYFMLKLLIRGYRIKLDSIPLHIMHEHNQNRITKTSQTKSLIALDTLKTFKYSHRTLFNSAQWNSIELRHLKMKATIFYLNRRYIDRLKSFRIYMIIFMKEPSLPVFRMLFRTLLPF